MEEGFETHDWRHELPKDNELSSERSLEMYNWTVGHMFSTHF